jgi:hypothetical protein
VSKERTQKKEKGRKGKKEGESRMFSNMDGRRGKFFY